MNKLIHLDIMKSQQGWRVTRSHSYVTGTEKRSQFSIFGTGRKDEIQMGRPAASPRYWPISKTSIEGTVHFFNCIETHNPSTGQPPRSTYIIMAAQSANTTVQYMDQEIDSSLNRLSRPLPTVFRSLCK